MSTLCSDPVTAHLDIRIYPEADISELEYLNEKGLLYRNIESNIIEDHAFAFMSPNDLPRR